MTFRRQEGKNVLHEVACLILSSSSRNWIARRIENREIEHPIKNAEEEEDLSFRKGTLSGMSGILNSSKPFRLQL